MAPIIFIPLVKRPAANVLVASSECALTAQLPLVNASSRSQLFVPMLSYLTIAVIFPIFPNPHHRLTPALALSRPRDGMLRPHYAHRTKGPPFHPFATVLRHIGGRTSLRKLSFRLNFTSTTQHGQDNRSDVDRRCLGQIGNVCDCTFPFGCIIANMEDEKDIDELQLRMRDPGACGQSLSEIKAPRSIPIYSDPWVRV